MKNKFFFLVMFIAFLLALTACAAASAAAGILEDYEPSYQFTREHWLTGLGYEYRNLTDLEHFMQTAIDFVHNPISSENSRDFLEFAYTFLNNHPEALTWEELLPHRIPDFFEEQFLDFSPSDYIDYAKLSQWVENTHNNFTWLDFFTPEQITIAKEYIKVDDEKTITDWIFRSYFGRVIIPWGNFDTHGLLPTYDLLRYYDAMLFDENTDNPRRILVRMYEVYFLSAFEMREFHAGESISWFSGEFGREMVDWR